MEIIVMASGNGSNAQKIFDTAALYPGKVRLAALVCDREGAMVIERAKRLGIPCLVNPKLKGETRSEHEARIFLWLKKQQVKLDMAWVLMAGYMRLLTPEFLGRFRHQALGVSRVVNIHPSLLPAFPGGGGFRPAWDYGVKVSGVTLHFVDEGLDTGPIIAQASFERAPQDTFEQFQQKGHSLEHQLYGQLVGQLAQGNIWEDLWVVKLSPLGRKTP